MQERLATHGIALTPRTWVIDPPAGQQDARGTNLEAVAITALVIGFGVLEIVLLAGTAFAVGARRQAREHGLILASGGSPRVVRRIVIAQGLVLGLIGTAAGVGLTILVALLGKPGWERMFNHLIDDWVIPVLPLVGVALVGLLGRTGRRRRTGRHR